MSCCSAGGEDAQRNEIINRGLREEKKRLDNEVKLLLLGAGESGKSTIAKQMKIIHKDGFPVEERNSYKSIIYNNVVSAMRVLVNAANELGISITRKDIADKFINGNEEYFNGPLSPEIGQMIKTLWADAGIKETFAQSSKFQLIDSAQYYFDNIDRLAAADYNPSEQDVLRSRAKTTGIIEIEFDVDKTHFRMVDVGGQRSEPLSEYDLKLQEDDQTNRMHESVKLFKEICNSKWFVDTSMILFLNKKDLFEEKIKRVDLTVAFPEYTGGKNYKAASQFIQEKFLSQNENGGKVIYPHITCATDTENVTIVFNAVKDIILRKALDSAGIPI